MKDPKKKAKSIKEIITKEIITIDIVVINLKVAMIIKSRNKISHTIRNLIAEVRLILKDLPETIQPSTSLQAVNPATA